VGIQQGAGANSQAEGRGASQTGANSQAEGRQTPNPVPGAPAAAAGSNSQVEGSSDPQASSAADDENATVSAAQHRETLREAKVNREKWQAAEKRLQALEDAKLSEQERDKKRLQEAETQVAEALRANYALRLQIAIEERVQTLNLVSAKAVKALLIQEYADQLDDDLGNVAYVINQAIVDNAWLQKPEPGTQPPNSGRSVSPPRTPAGQYARQQAQEPVSPKDWKNLGALSKEDWDKLGGNQGQ
jgi:hypothetical protein